MNGDTAIVGIDRLVALETGKHLNDLQIFLLQQVWLGKKYTEIAEDYHCTEGHVKDIAADLWKLLSQLVGERVTKTNLRSILKRHITTLTTPQPVITAPESHDYRFIGREVAIAKLDELIQQGQRTIVIQGEGGIGKTTLAQEYLKTCGCDLILELLMAKETAQIASAEIVVEEWLLQDLQIEPGREFSVTLFRLKRQLSHRKIGILIDNLEPALDGRGKIVSTHRSYVELLRILTDRQLPGITLITSRDRLCEVDLNLTHYRLSGLDLDTWYTYFKYRQITTLPTEITPLHQTYGGNAKAMEIIAGIIGADFDGDVAAYIRAARNLQLVETSLKQLIGNQFDRLQTLDADAYQLLCRAGCYRDRDLAQVSTEALSCLLWDVKLEDRSQIIDALKNRSLIEYHRGKYWLHPAIRTEAISRLRNSADWILANRSAAKFWTNSVVKITSLNAAITALEAYYHYLAIDDFDRAASVLLKPRDNQWGQFLPLASNLYRMGSTQSVLTAIVQIIPSLKPSRNTAELYNILGDLYWIVGRVHEAIDTQYQAFNMANNILDSLEDYSHDAYCLEILKIDSLSSIGLYHIDLWELTEASNLFDRVIVIASNTVHDRWAQKATICLALVQSYLGNIDRTKELLTQIEPLINDPQWTGSSAYFLQSIGQIYTNIGEFERANIIYQRTLIFCQTGNYLQIQAKTLNGIAQIYRAQGNLKLAQQKHLESIDILIQIGAKCDLAEAYYQAGLTWKATNDPIQSKIYNDNARQLFTEISAPAQLAKIANLYK
jgi:tetratricopeptide (TPR) repeat protein